ncbi:MarR family transcriptional regulator [Nocardia tengchongensis]|uniref:MarR family transcriptional regulator n=1 Tax=Nocardia tengchongensis TaxID=2055889 RepID=UPI0036BB44F5
MVIRAVVPGFFSSRFSETGDTSISRPEGSRDGGIGACIEQPDRVPITRPQGFSSIPQQGSHGMTTAEFAVLNVLSRVERLSTKEIQRAASLTGWSTRNALAQLAARGLVVPSVSHGRWQISARGRSAVAVKRKQFG